MGKHRTAFPTLLAATIQVLLFSCCSCLKFTLHGSKYMRQKLVRGQTVSVSYALLMRYSPSKRNGHGVRNLFNFNVTDPHGYVIQGSTQFKEEELLIVPRTTGIHTLGFSSLSQLAIVIEFNIRTLQLQKLARLYSEEQEEYEWQDIDMYNRTLAMHMVEYASIAYIDNEVDVCAWNCSRCRGLTAGFKTTAVIRDPSKKLQGYIGISEALNSIVISFRGTHVSSIMNWVADLRFLQLNLSYPGVQNAMVHGGFYSAYHNTTLREKFVKEVEAIRQKRPDLGLAVTGHSLGAAIACLCALDFKVNVNLSKVEIVTFGQPRVGNKPFSDFFRLKLPEAIRMTHGHDPVVHLPLEGAAGSLYAYHHTATEVWLHDVQIMKNRWLHVEQVCDGSGEDPLCSRSVLGNRLMDHLLYMGIPLYNNL